MSSTIHYILGKGGVGKTRISVMLAKHLAKQNKNVLLVEVQGCTDIPLYWNIPSKGYAITSLERNISAFSITPTEAIEEYALQQLRIKGLFELIFRNRLVSALVNSAPGLHDAVQLGKIYDLATQAQYRNFTDIIVDCPSTGHGIALLTAAKTMMNVSRSGTLYEKNKLVDTVMHKQAKIWLVTIPTELPCLELFALHKHIQETWHPHSHPIQGIFVNQYQPFDTTLFETTTLHNLAPIQQTHPLEYQQLQCLQTQWQHEYRNQEHWWQELQTLGLAMYAQPWTSSLEFEAKLTAMLQEQL